MPESAQPADPLESILVGGRERREIVIAGYDAAWPRRFEQERTRILDALGSRAIRIEHIGSTSVPGLPAKPIVDICVTVADTDDEASFGPRLEAAGYVLRVREPGHRMFRTAALDVHLHVYTDDSIEVERYLAFRDWLRNNEADRALYAARKRELASQDWSDMNDYADAKTSVVMDILARADAASRSARR